MISSKNWELRIDSRIHTELDRFPKKDAEYIIGVIESSSFDPYGGDIQKIKGEKHIWRRRIGAYRIFYEINQDKGLVHIFWVERRTSKTYHR